MRFDAPNIKNKTLGASIQPVFEAMGDEVTDTLKKHGLYNLDPDKWYDQQDYLNVFNDIYDTGMENMFNMVSIGIKVLGNAAFPPQIETLEQALNSMDAYYHLNNQDDLGGWQVNIEGKVAKCVSTTPFPADFEYGIVYALTQRFLPEDHNFKVEYDGFGMTNKGPENPCTYTITWEYDPEIRH